MFAGQLWLTYDDLQIHCREIAYMDLDKYVEPIMWLQLPSPVCTYMCMYICPNRTFNMYDKATSVS